MKIGIIGYGKMGKDILSCLSEKLNDVEFVIIVRHNANDFADEIEKRLGKDLLILDIGFNTIDILCVKEGRSSSEWRSAGNRRSPRPGIRTAFHGCASPPARRLSAR